MKIITLCVLFFFWIYMTFIKKAYIACFFTSVAIVFMLFLYFYPETVAADFSATMEWIFNH